MKKALSLILAIVMVFALATTAFAAKTDVVGDYNNAEVEGIAKGSSTFDVKDNSTTINISATQGQVEHRYAVDIDYTPMTFDISASTMVWDVTQLKYVLADGTNNTMTDKSFPVTITNYSDVDIYLTTNVLDADAADGVVVTTGVADHTTIVSAVTGVTTPYNFDVAVKADTEGGKDWAYISNYYATKFAAEPTATSILVATLTLNLSIN